MPGSGRQRLTRKVNEEFEEFRNDMRAQARRNPGRFINNFMYIKPNRPGAPLELMQRNHPQLVSAAIRQADLEAGRPVRHYELKARRVGISTDCVIEGFTYTWAYDNWDSLIIAHDKERASKLLAMAHIANEHLPIPLQLLIEKESTEHLRFGGTHSGMTIKTAANFMKASRGDGQMYAQCSELCYYDDPKGVLMAVCVLVPYLPGTIIRAETTAQGAGTQAHDLWLEALENNTNIANGKPLAKNSFRAIFHAWQDDPANSLPFNNDIEKAARMEQILFEYPELRGRMEVYMLTPEQVHWYYQHLLTTCFGDTKFMCQEFPCDQEEAWLSSGTPIFAARQLGGYFKNCRAGLLLGVTKKDQGVEGELKVFRRFEDVDETPHADRETEPYIEVWQRPLQGRRYAIGVDSSAGYAKGDFTSMFVLDMITLEMCAEFHGRVEPSDGAKIAGSLALIYNNALVAPELDGLGMALLSHLKEWYWHIYQQRIESSFGLKITDKLGWSTNTSTRPSLIANGKRLFLEKHRQGEESYSMFIKSKGLVQELRSFVTGPGGKPQAAPGKFDDRVMAWLIALIVIFQELYGTVAKEDGALPAPAYAAQGTGDVSSKPKMSQVMEDILEGGRGWAKSTGLFYGDDD